MSETEDKCQQCGCRFHIVGMLGNLPKRLHCGNWNPDNEHAHCLIQQRDNMLASKLTIERDQLERELDAAMAELDREIQAKHRIAMETRNPLLAKLEALSAELAAKDARIRRLEEAGDAMVDAIQSVQDWNETYVGDCVDGWTKAKETQP